VGGVGGASRSIVPSVLHWHFTSQSIAGGSTECVRVLLPSFTRTQTVLVSQMRNLMTPNTRASRKIFFAKFDATGDLALLRHPKVMIT
jgi:hypothetical protein